MHERDLATLSLSMSNLRHSVELLIHTVNRHGQLLDQLRADIAELHTQGVKMHEEFAALSKRLDDATNAIAAELKTLRDQISGGLSADEAKSAVEKLTAQITTLEAMGKDPVNPVPG